MSPSIAVPAARLSWAMLALEVIAKRRYSICAPGERSGSWVKLNLDLEQEPVIAGFRPDGAKAHELLVGYYLRKHLHFAAKVRAGSVRATELIAELMVYV